MDEHRVDTENKTRVRGFTASQVVIAVTVVAALGLVALVLFQLAHREPTFESTQTAGSDSNSLPILEATPAPKPNPGAENEPSAPPNPAFVRTPLVPVRSGGSKAPSPLPAASARSQQIIHDLTQLESGKLTPERIAFIKSQLQQLSSEGLASIPAIRQFLERSEDLAFDDGAGGSEVGFPSLRAAFVDLLKQVPGSESNDALLSVLRSTADPVELASIAHFLDGQAPGQYQQETVNAARETLNQALRGTLQVNDAGPLFKLLREYGDSNVAADLAQAMPQWHYYAMMALAGLPEGQGVSTLVQRTVEASKAGRTDQAFALQMLAQVSAQNAEAAAALVEQARANQIPDRAWTKIAEGLAGDQYRLEKPATDPAGETPLAGLKTYHIESGNQNFYSLPFQIYGTPEEAAQRRAVLDQLLSSTQNPAAVQALQQARANLLASP